MIPRRDRLTSIKGPDGNRGVFLSANVPWERPAERCKHCEDRGFIIQTCADGGHYIKVACYCIRAKQDEDPRPPMPYIQFLERELRARSEVLLAEIRHWG